MSRLAPILLISLIAGEARADRAVHFGAADVQTIFFIGKSDDGNQVHYGIHLTQECKPVGAEPIFGYWRQFDLGPSAPMLTLSWLDGAGYGIDHQVVSTTTPGVVALVSMAIRPARERVIDVLVTRAADGSCRAEPRLNLIGRRAILKQIYLKLRGPFVEWVEIRAVALDDGTSLRERVML